ncbi:glycosyltransferase family 39 protein [Patescibacteria group bacterium]|nr:glycosyltransferase family 39 protein [Patescibacteria group bacterium]
MRKLLKIVPYIILIISIGLAILTRFYKLGEAPKGLYIDEAGQGYNAYSILKTGKDEFGKPFPIVFRSFTDFKTPIYIYLIVPLIPIFGLTAFTVRFPSFFFSILTIPLIFFLIKELVPKKGGLYLAGLTSLLLAISPWHILFGRTNFECNVALFFFLGGVYLFLKGLKNPKLLVFSAISFAIAIPAYHAQRVVTPLMVIILFLKYRKILLSKTHIRSLLSGAFLAFLISLPTLSIALTPGFLARASGLNIFSFNRASPPGFMAGKTGLLGWIVNNLPFLSSREFFSLYFSYLFPRNMFVLGDYGPRSSFPDLATFFLWQAPFYLSGLYLLIKNKKLGELRFFTLALLLIGPIPAAVTRDPYSSIRSLQLVIPQNIIIALGLYRTFQFFSKRIFKIFFISTFSLLVIYSLTKLYSSVIILNEFYRAQDWNYGWEQVTDTLKTLDPKVPIVIDTARENPYIQILFYLKFDPVIFQKDNFEVPLNEYYTNMHIEHAKKIGNIITRPIDWKPDAVKEQYLVGDALAISPQQIAEHKLTIIGDVYYPDGRLAYKIVKTNPLLKALSK